MPDFERLFEDSDGYWSRFFAREEVYDHEERSGFDSDHINNNSSNEEEHGEEHKEEASLTVHGLVSHPDQTIEAIDDAASLISSASSSSTTITTTTNCSSSSFSSSSSEPFQLIPRSSSEVPVWVTWKAGMEVMFFFDRSFDVRRAPAQVALLLNSGQFKSAINLAGDLNDNGLYHDCVDLSPVVHV